MYIYIDVNNFISDIESANGIFTMNAVVVFVLDILSSYNDAEVLSVTENRMKEMIDAFVFQTSANTLLASSPSGATLTPTKTASSISFVNVVTQNGNQITTQSSNTTTSSNTTESSMTTSSTLTTIEIESTTNSTNTSIVEATTTNTAEIDNLATLTLSQKKRVILSGPSSSVNTSSLDTEV